VTKNDLDLLDLRILVATLERPRVGVREHARTLMVARGTVQARLDKLQRLGVITDLAPRVSVEGLGYTDLAYVRLNLAQGVLDEVTSLLARVPEILSVDSIAGDADLLCQVVSTGPENLEQVIQEILAIPGVMRSRTETVLRRRVRDRVRPLIDRLAREA
jgi:DNA-binding Lrp family transcriptional regulator